MSQKAFVIHVVFNDGRNFEDSNYKLEEAVNLAEALNLEVINKEIFKTKEFSPAFLLKKGFLENIKLLTAEQEINVVIINYSLSAIQQRNLERYLNTKVIDRSALIISIFEDRAKSKEGRIQATLANLYYQKSRIVKAWSHLERQKGGGGFIGGPGETQKELDKRIITDKIKLLTEKLKKVKLNRKIKSNYRKKLDYKTVVLVGYTNAGKSTLFNTLTNSNEFSKDLLFATLDPKITMLELKAKQKVILSDTVGFISDLPHQLVEAFHSTLDEVKDADILLHIIDANQAQYQEQIVSVKKVLNEIGINEILYQEKAIEVFNKVDLLDCNQKEFFQNYLLSHSDCVLLSAQTQEGIIELKDMIFNKINLNKKKIKISINYKHNDLLIFLYKNTDILNKRDTENSINLEILASEYIVDQIQTLFKGKYEEISF